MLADHGYARETTRSCWSGPGRLWLDQLPLPAASRTVITDLLELIDAVQVSIDRVDAPLRAEAKNEPWVKVLTTLPGGGPLTALVLLAEIGDIQRFPSARKLAFWTGLSPTVRGSDRTVHYRRISRQGDPWVRWILSEAARTAKRSPQFAACYEQIAHRRGEKITTIAIARKLLTRTWHLLME